jgi:hypothetical protein
LVPLLPQAKACGAWQLEREPKFILERHHNASSENGRSTHSPTFDILMYWYDAHF